MIPVDPGEEPATFDAAVRQPGIAWMIEKGFQGLAAFPPKTKVKAIWTACLPDMLATYDRICAYASLRIAPITGAQSVDHFAPKSRAPADTYEWTNYRLACSKMNARKNNFTDVLDPFTLRANTFELDILTGGIRPAPGVVGADLDIADATVKRLGLDDGEMRAARLEIINYYLEGHISEQRLLCESPFIWSELRRMGVGPV